MVYAHHIAVIRRLIRAGALQRAEKVLDKVPARDLSQVLSELEKSEIRLLASCLVAPKRVQRTFCHLPKEIREFLLAPLELEEIARLLEGLSPGAAEAVLSALPEERAVHFNTQLKQRSQVGRTVVDVMGPIPFALHKKVSAQGAIEAIRQSPNRCDLFYLYVLDDDKSLAGVVPLRRLVTATADESLSSLLTPGPLFVSETALAEEAAQVIGEHGLLALPVLDGNHRLLGLIKTDDVFELMTCVEPAVTEQNNVPEAKPSETERPGVGSWGQWFPFFTSRRGRTTKPASSLN